MKNLECKKTYYYKEFMIKWLPTKYGDEKWGVFPPGDPKVYDVFRTLEVAKKAIRNYPKTIKKGD